MIFSLLLQANVHKENLVVDSKADRHLSADLNPCLQDIVETSGCVCLAYRLGFDLVLFHSMATLRNMPGSLVPSGKPADPSVPKDSSNTKNQLPRRRKERGA